MYVCMYMYLYECIYMYAHMNIYVRAAGGWGGDTCMGMALDSG